MVPLDEIWNPAQPLPDGPVLARLCEAMLDAWRQAGHPVSEGLARRLHVGYNPRMRTALGRAFLAQGRIELNIRLLREHPAELVPTLAHELAHLVAHDRFGRVAPHGLHFRVLMNVIGRSGRATHKLPAGHLRRTRRRYHYLHRCTGCGMEFTAGRVRRDVYCRACGPGVPFRVWRQAAP